MADETFISTGNELTDAIANLEKLIKLNQNFLELRNIYNYDELLQINTPSLSIVFDNAIPEARGLGSALEGGFGRPNKCCNSIMNINMVIYLYLETLSLGKETFEHIARLGNLTKIIYQNRGLFKLCPDNITITRAALTGRRLESDVYLTGQVDLTVPIRF